MTSYACVYIFFLLNQTTHYCVLYSLYLPKPILAAPLFTGIHHSAHLIGQTFTLDALSRHKAFVSPNLPTSSQMPSLGSANQSLIYCRVWLLLSLRAGRTNCRLIQTLPAAVNLCLVLLLAHLLPLSACSTGGPGVASKPFVFCFCPGCCCW